LIEGNELKRIAARDSRRCLAAYRCRAPLNHAAIGAGTGRQRWRRRSGSESIAN
jgi:hypothetical protein